MAIRFRANLEILIADIVAGGFCVQEIQTIADSCGRTIDIRLNNDVVICWDSYSKFVWAEGALSQMNEVERYLRKIYEGPKLLRRFVAWRTRLKLRLKSQSQATAIWLLRNNGLPARSLRQLIMCVPYIPKKQHHYQPSLPHQR